MAVFNSHTPPFKSTLELALHYASLGIPVLPLHYITADGVCSCGGERLNKNCKPGKHPFGRLVHHGRNDATTDLEVISGWFTGTPYNIGIATGIESDIFVLDRDDRDGGDKSLQALEAQHEQLPETLTQKTGNGMHYVFQMPEGAKVKNGQSKFAPGLDVRGVGGYIVAAPSVHENGNIYTWLGDELPLRETISTAPDWLIAEIHKTPTKSKPKPHVNLGHSTDDFEIPDQIKDGQGREAFILKYAGHLRGKGLDQNTIERRLLDYNKHHIDPPLEEHEVLDRARRYEQHAIEDPDGWTEPTPVLSSLPPVQAFDDCLLPNNLRPWVMDIADRMQCPPDYPAVGAIVAVGAVVGNRIGVQPKAKDTSWYEVPNLWGAIVGRPGQMKTPALAQVMSPLKKLESAASSAFSKAHAKYEIDRQIYEGQKKKAVANCIKTGTPIPPGQLLTQPTEPQRQRYVVNDATYQKLGDVLSGNPHGLLVFQDELAGLFVRLDAPGQEAARAFYLEAWSGTSSYTFDRVERGTVAIPRLCFSLFGGLQPTKLSEYLRSAVLGSKGDDGLAQRLQLLVYPDTSKTWKQVDRSVDLAAASVANAVFDRLANLDPFAIGAVATHPDAIPVLQFSPEAQIAFNAWWSALENALRRDSNAPVLESHLSKYRSLIPTLALLDHLIDGRSGDIQLDSLLRAFNWHKYLYSHAKRCYASVTSTSMESAKQLAMHIKRGDLKDSFTIRDVYRKSWSQLGTVKDATDAVEILVDLGWLRAARFDHELTTEGRPTVRYQINPQAQTEK